MLLMLRTKAIRFGSPSTLLTSRFAFALLRWSQLAGSHPAIWKSRESYVSRIPHSETPNSRWTDRIRTMNLVADDDEDDGLIRCAATQYVRRHHVLLRLMLIRILASHTCTRRIQNLTKISTGYHQSTTHYAMDCTTTNRAPALPHENHEDNSHYLTPAMAKVSFVKSSLFLGPNS